MDAVNQLLDQARVGTNLPSDNALAQRMGVTRAVVSNWRQARNPIPDERIAQLCAMAKLDGPAWTARIHAERAASPAERAMWKSMLDRLSAVAAVLALVVFTAPGAARAKAIDSQGFSGSDQPHSVYYVQSNPGVAGTYLASIPSPAVAWSLIVRDRNLTGPWAGFSFKGGRLVTPEGRELEPQDLAWLSLLAAQAQEWRRMMEIARGGQKRPFGRAGIVDLAEVAHRRAKRPSTVMAGPDADPVAGVLPVPGPRPRQRV